MTTHSLPEAITNTYEVAEHIGAGGQGSVYRAVDRASGRPVALKVFHRPFDAAGTQQQFEREVAALERLRPIPGVVSVKAHGVADERGWLVTERFPGTLADRVRSLGQLDHVEVRDVGAALAETLDAVHNAGVLHRDLKPSNVFLRPDGSPVLGDFGVARIVDERTLTASRGASLGFVAPEVIERGETSRASDIYGLGATLYALLEGHPPHHDATSVTETPIGLLIRRITDGEPVLFSPAVPHDLRTIIHQLLAQDPAQRPASGASVAARLRKGPTATTDVSTSLSRPRRRLVGIAATAAVLLGAIVAGFMLWPSTSSPQTATETAPVEPAAAALQPGVAGCPTTVSASAVLLCETFDSLAGWDQLEEPTTAEISVRDGRVIFTPPEGAVAGSSYVERSIGALPAATDLFVQVRLALTGTAVPPGPAALEPWWQNMFVIADESQHTWSTGVQWLNGGFAVDLGFADPPDHYGGVLGDEPLALDDEDGVCLELVLGRSDGRAPALLADDAEHATVIDAEARNYGDGYVARVGPVWLDPDAGAPVLEVDQLIVATEPIGC